MSLVPASMLRIIRRAWVLILLAFISFAFILVLEFFSGSGQFWLGAPDIPNQVDRVVSGTVPEVALVAASQTKDNTTWLHHFGEWQRNIYVTDDRTAKLTVPVNKGREGQVFLTYIIDNYDHLPEVIIFSHADRYQWHNDDPLYDGKRMLERLQIPYIKQEGYINLRCVHTLGCPAEIKPFEEHHADPTGKDSEAEDAKAGSYYLDAFEYLFPGIEVPKEIGVSCCAQFAATGWKIRERPLSDYVKYRDWLTETSLKDDLSGRILEYAWHIIFGKDAVYCPSAPDCYCNVYGLCNLTCEHAGVCDSQYTLPKYSTLPKGWPDYGWDDKWRNVTELRAQQELDYAPKLQDQSSGQA